MEMVGLGMGECMGVAGVGGQMWKGGGMGLGAQELRRGGQKSCTQRPKGQALHLGSTCG